MDIGKRIILLREKKGWSQRELARRVNLNPSVMNRIEQSERPIKDKELAKIADVLDVTTDYLLGRSNDPKLTEKDEKDIAKRLEKFKDELEYSDGLSFSGEPLSEEAKESLIESMEYIFRQTQKINKKYVPKKYRKE